MVLATGSRGIHIGEQHTRYMVFASEGMVVVEMAVPADGLTVLGAAHGHVTCHHLVTFLLQRNNDVIHIIVTPSRNKHGVLVVVCQTVVGSIVNREHGLERQAFDELVHVVDDTGIELELAADILRLTAEVAVGNGIRLDRLRAAGEVPAVQQVQRLVQGGQCQGGIRVHHIDVNQRGSILWEVRAHRCCSTPEVTLVLVGIVEGSAGIGKTLDHLVDDEIHITTDAETVGIVVLGITEVQQVLMAIVVDVRIEVCTLATTLNLHCSIRPVIGLTDILV